MDPNIRYLGIGAGVRTLGMALFGPFVGLFLHYVLGVGYVEIAAILVTMGILPIPASFVGGLVADRFGRRRLFLLSLAGEAALVGLLGYAMLLQSFLAVVSVGFASSVASSLASPALSAYVADHATGSERTKAFTWWRVGSNAGFAFGAALGGFLIPFFGFGRTTLLSAAVLGAAVLFLALLLSPSPYDRELASRVRAEPTVLPAPKGEAVPPVRSRQPSVRESLRAVGRDRGFLLVCFSMALAQITIGQWGSSLQLFVVGPMHVSYPALGAGLALNGAIVVLGQTATTRRVLGRRLTTVFIAGLALYGVAFLALGLSTLYLFFPTVVFFVSVAVMTVGENLTAITYSTLPSNLAPKEEVGAYNGGFNAFVTVGGLAATMVGGVALASVPDPVLFWVILIAPSLPAAWLLHRSSRTLPSAADRA